MILFMSCNSVRPYCNNEISHFVLAAVINVDITSHGSRCRTVFRQADAAAEIGESRV